MEEHLESLYDLERDVRKIWLWCAKHPVREEEYRHWMETGQWLTDPPADVAPVETLPDIEAVKPPPVPNGPMLPPVPGMMLPPAAGHNSGVQEAAFPSRELVGQHLHVFELRRQLLVIAGQSGGF